MTIGERIKLRREELKMSQDELAKRLGYKSRSSINKIEIGSRDLTKAKIKAIADVLETTPSFIMGWTDEWEEKFNPNGSLASEVSIFEAIQNLYGEEACEAFDMYTQLDSADQGEIRGEMKHMLRAEKYTKLQTHIVKIAARNGQFQELPMTDSQLDEIMNLPNVDDLL